MSEESSTSSVRETSESLSSGGNIFVYHLYGSTLEPDCSGEYRLNGIGEGKPIYQRKDDLFMICWKESFSRWEIIEFSSAKFWIREDANLFGEFTPHAGVQGDPLVMVD